MQQDAPQADSRQLSVEQRIRSASWNRVASIPLAILALGAGVSFGSIPSHSLVGELVECGTLVDPAGKTLLDAASNNGTFSVTLGNDAIGLSVFLSSSFDPGTEEGAGRPFNLNGTVYFIRGWSASGNTILAGFVRCDFFTAAIQNNGTIVQELGEQSDPRPHDPNFNPVMDPHIPDDTLPPTKIPTVEPGGSIEFVKHIWTSQADDPVNVLFFDAPSGTINHLIKEFGRSFQDGVCGGTHYAWFFDAQHGGANSWQRQNTNWDNKEVKWNCAGDRWHARQYQSAAPNGDNHVPGFEHYALMPTHTERQVNHNSPNPQRGQDYLAYYMKNNHHVKSNYHFAVFRGTCGDCNEWKGVLDVYEISAQEPNDVKNCVSMKFKERTSNGFDLVELMCRTRHQMHPD